MINKKRKRKRWEGGGGETALLYRIGAVIQTPHIMCTSYWADHGKSGISRRTELLLLMLGN